MKMKRIISLAIAMLLVCGMPVSAFAEFINENPDGATISVSSGQTLHINNGTVTTNDGVLIWNYGTVEDNNHNISGNYGTVEDNNKSASVTDNSNTVVNNNGNVETNQRAGTVTTNNGTVDYNYGTVDNNSSTGTVTTNLGSVQTNEGGKVVNNGTADNNANAKVGTNNGTVYTNYGTVTDNKKDVNSNKGTVTNNKGTVLHNDGTVTNNYKTVVQNYSVGKVITNNNGATVSINNGTVETNNGTIYTNGGTVTENNGTISQAESGSKIITNNGTVANQNLGTVETNNGTVNGNYTTVETNNITGVVNNKSNNYGQKGTVDTNYGTVNEADGSTHYGVQVEGSLFQKNKGEDFDLTQFTKAGYVLTGYIQQYLMGSNGPVPQDGLITVDGTVYKEDCPNVLTLIWQAIAGSDEETEYFGPGCYISINGKQYILVEIKDEDYYLASCEEYTKEELAEADALLKTLLTEEQLSHVTGSAGILEGELNELFFGGGSRIVFPCDIGMIFH